MRDEIPQRAFINAQIMQKVHDDPNFQRAVASVAEGYGIGEYQFMNPAYVASLLYCLLVVPRELFVSPQDKLFDEKLPAEEMTAFFDIEVDTEGVASTSSQFLRRLRNSIAHARFSVDHAMNFQFIDASRGASQDEFRVTASSSQLMRFISRIGAFLANLRTSPLTGAIE